MDKRDGTPGGGVQEEVDLSVVKCQRFEREAGSHRKPTQICDVSFGAN